MKSKKGLNFLEGVVIVIGVVTIEVLIKKVLGGNYYNNFVMATVRVLAYCFVFAGIRELKEIKDKSLNSFNFLPGAKLSFVMIIFSLFLFSSILLEAEAIIKLGYEDYIFSFNEKRNIKANFLMMLVVSPIFEEIFFRRFLLNGFWEKYGVKRAILFSSLLFACVHIEVQDINIFSKIISVFFLGLVLSWAKVETGSIRFTMFLHFFWNLLNPLKGIGIVIFDLYLNSELDVVFLFSTSIVLGLIILYFNRWHFNLRTWDAKVKDGIN